MGAGAAAFMARDRPGPPQCMVCPFDRGGAGSAVDLPPARGVVCCCGVCAGGRRNAWFALSIEAGLLLLTTSAAPGLLLLVAGFALATARGRRTLLALDPLFALLVIMVLALPWLIWLIRANIIALPPLPGTA